MRRRWRVNPAGRMVPDMKTSSHPKSDVELFVVCPVCGQIFDCRDEVQVRHHAEALHEPLLT